MSTILAAVGTQTVDARMAAFLDPECSEVFHSVATPNAIQQADPYDVEDIHADARQGFEALLHRGARPTPSPSGAVLVVHGEAGSGKTHLMRAFRTRAHRQRLAYCAYLQMTAEASNYARYMLANVIDGLEADYDPDAPSRSSLERLATALLESVPGLTEDDRLRFREAEENSGPLVDAYADRLRTMAAFGACDIEVLRVFLHLERREPRVHVRVMMWLRCQDMRPQDRDWIGGAVPRTDEAEPMRMLIQLARLVGAIHHVPLVLLIDQLEDIANQSTPIERFVKVVDAITAYTDNAPNALVVLACLEDYFNEQIEKVTRSKKDRLMRDPVPVRLLANRTPDEIEAMTARRLRYLYDASGVDVNALDELYPFSKSCLARLAGRRSRDALHALQQHHQRCILAGRWAEPDTDSSGQPLTGLDSTPPNAALDAVWNDFHSGFAGTVSDEEEELARILAGAVRGVSAELPSGFHLDVGAPDGRYLEVETHRPDGSVAKRLVAICNANVRGVGFSRQIAELEKRAGEISVAIVRTTDFPKTGKAIAQIAGMLKRDGEKVVAADADWRRMLAFAEFRRQHAGRADFAAWQGKARPLGELPSLQRLFGHGKVMVGTRGAGLPNRPAPRSASVQPSTPILPACPSGQGEPEIIFGRGIGVQGSLVTFRAKEFVQHAAFLGGSGSGKTTAALNLIEQLLAMDVPAVLLDRKGDLCRYVDSTAWERSLQDGGHAEARKALRDKLDIALYTPGEPAGRPLSIPVVPPGFDQLPEADRERFAQYAAGALGSMIGFRSSDADKGQRAILAKAIETLAGVPGTIINVSVLRDVVENQDDALVNAIGGQYPPKYFKNLGERLLTLELNNRQLLAGGPTLDIDALLGTGVHARPGRVKLSIISTRFLGDPAKVDFWVSQFLVAISRWCARAPRPYLQAVFLFDEADVYLPAGMRQPATKAPMEDLLKRARSAGLGIFLATQSPGDFDYRCKENVRTWVIGQIKETRAIEKIKPMLTAARTDVTDKLAGQKLGEFYVVRDSSVTAVRSDESFLRTEQMPEEEIMRLAQKTA